MKFDHFPKNVEKCSFMFLNGIVFSRTVRLPLPIFLNIIIPFCMVCFSIDYNFGQNQHKGKVNPSIVNGNPKLVPIGAFL